MSGYVLVYRNSKRRGEEIPITAEEMIVGRSRSCALTLPTNDISRRHAAVHIKLGKVIVRDLGSRNGTRVNGEKIPVDVPVTVNDHDKLQFGKWKFRVLAVAPDGSTNFNPNEVDSIHPNGTDDLLSELDRIAASLELEGGDVNETRSVYITGTSIDEPAPRVAHENPEHNDSDKQAGEVGRDVQSGNDTNGESGAKVDEAVPTKVQFVDRTDKLTEAGADKVDIEEEQTGPRKLPKHLRPRGPENSQNAAEEALKRMFGG